MTTKYLTERIPMVWKIMSKIGSLFSMIVFIGVLMVGPPVAAYAQGGNFSFHVHVFFDYVWVYNLDSSTVILTIDDPATPPIDFTTSATVAPEGGRINFAEDFDVQAGHVVKVTDGEIEKTHTVTGVRVVSVDTEKDIIYGTALPDSGEVEVSVCEDNGNEYSFFATPNDGNWQVNTTEDGENPIDLLPKHGGTASQKDDDSNNATLFDWPLWFECVGFEPALDNEDEIITVKKNRCFSFRAELRDHQDILSGVTLDDIKIPPILWISEPDSVNTFSDIVTIEGLSPGLETDGNQFEFIGGMWIFNLKVKNYSPGTYTVEMRPPLNGYRIEPTCRVAFVVEK